MRKDGLWTCKKCNCGFVPSTRARVCSACSPRQCRNCGGRTRRADALACEDCRPQRAVARASAWYAANKERKRAYDAKRRAEKRELYRAASKRHRQKHPGRKNATTAKRRADLANRLPPWATSDDCRVFYEMAARVSKCLGIPHHVDHIVPLRGETVSGLHVPWNLRVIPAAENLRKSNHYSLEHLGVR